MFSRTKEIVKANEKGGFMCTYTTVLDIVLYSNEIITIGSSSFCPKWGLSGRRTYFILRRIGKTFPGSPLEVVGLDRKLMGFENSSNNFDKLSFLYVVKPGMEKLIRMLVAPNDSHFSFGR